MFLLLWQTFQIPTMQNGPDLAKRFYRELTDIQVRGRHLVVATRNCVVPAWLLLKKMKIGHSLKS